MPPLRAPRRRVTPNQRVQTIQEKGENSIAVPVVKGGLYDRYRSNPPLSVIEAELPAVDLSWFKDLKKERVDIGFESYSPNFYYKNSSVTAVFTADLDRRREPGARDLAGPDDVERIPGGTYHGSSTSAVSVTLTLKEGSLSSFIKSLKLGTSSEVKLSRRQNRKSLI